MRAAIAVILISTAAIAEPRTIPAHYAKLFEKGKTWTYDVTVTTWDYAKLETMDMSKHPWPKHTDAFVAICKVARVVTLGASTVSEVTCDKAVDRKFDRTLPGLYVARADGLHHAGTGVDFPTTEAELDGTDLLIAAKPKEDQIKTKDDFSHAVSIQGVRKSGDGWCSYANFEQAADGGKTSLCFDGGITRGGDDAGGELNDVKFHAR